MSTDSIYEMISLVNMVVESDIDLNVCRGERALKVFVPIGANIETDEPSVVTMRVGLADLARNVASPSTSSLSHDA